MSLNRWLVFGAFGLVFSGSALGPGEANAASQGHGRPEHTQAGPAISLDEAVARAERRYNARAVRAEEKRHGDRVEYRIRLLGDDGRVFEVRVDAATGRED
jgi:uncharacterized membrane protein YkoI